MQVGRPRARRTGCRFLAATIREEVTMMPSRRFRPVDDDEVTVTCPSCNWQNRLMLDADLRKGGEIKCSHCRRYLGYWHPERQEVYVGLMAADASRSSDSPGAAANRSSAEPQVSKDLHRGY
jgi:hypothetical protein